MTQDPQMNFGGGSMPPFAVESYRGIKGPRCFSDRARALERPLPPPDYGVRSPHTGLPPESRPPESCLRGRAWRLMKVCGRADRLKYFSSIGAQEPSARPESFLLLSLTTEAACAIPQARRLWNREPRP
mgnify:CR=1 FL=1